MKIRLVVVSLIIFLVLVPQVVFAQGETALPFLLITSSPEANGMAGISASVLTDNAMAPIANPGQLGLQSLNNFLWTSIYTPKTQWLPGFQQSDLTYLTSSINGGINLSRVLPLPFPISIGIGYSHIFLNLGKFVVTGPDPTPLGTFDAYEQSDNYTIGIGFDYFIRAGVGFTTKKVKSALASFSVQESERRGTAEISTNDFGLMAQIPVVGIVKKISGVPIMVFPNTEPLFDITLGYSRNNLGDKGVVYIDPSQTDPLPRTATIGLSWKAGFVSHATSEGWEIFSVTIAREALDILVNRPSQSWSYQEGFGDLQFFKNLISGKSFPNVWLRKGWQVSAGEFLSVRGGSLNAPGLNYTSTGFSFRLSGVLKVIQLLTPKVSSSFVQNLVFSHLDLQYNHASETQADGGPRSGNTYNSLNLIIK